MLSSLGTAAHLARPGATIRPMPDRPWTRAGSILTPEGEAFVRGGVERHHARREPESFPRRPEQAALLDEAMPDRSRQVDAAVPAAYDRTGLLAEVHDRLSDPVHER